MSEPAVEFSPSPAQRRAIEAPLGPVLVIAGPGAGKTSCLVARIEHLIESHGLAPDRLCAVTFTNKAAEEVAHRLEARLGDRARDVTRGTIHSLCLRILREFGGRVGLQAGFGVADELYQHALLARLRVPRKRRGPTLNLFGRHRLQDYELTPGDAALYRDYAAQLERANMADYDDLVVLTARLFQQNPDVADQVAARWDYILVDECQDLNPRQYDVIARLAAGHRNLFAVGDDEQSIFSWASADPKILAQLQEDFGIPEPIVLDRNRRCSERIFAAARQLIQQNPPLFAKRIEADRPGGDEVAVRLFEDENQEAAALIADILNDHRETGHPWGEYAVLYRRHESGELLETRLLAAGIPCRLSRGRALADDRVIAQVLASVRVILAPDDPLAPEALAELLLPGVLLDHIRTQHQGEGLLAGLRLYAMAHRGEPDAKKAWRFIYTVENLHALGREARTLAGLVDAVLQQGIGEFRNPLEGIAVELTDPPAYPGARELADALRGVRRSGGRIWLVPALGREIPVRRMLGKAGFTLFTTGSAPTDVPASDLVLRCSEPGQAVRLFKALQILESETWATRNNDFVAFDLETTDDDLNCCETIEIGAVRVRNGAVTETFHSMVRPTRPISVKATEVHTIRNEDVAQAPTFAEVWPRFVEFVGRDTLVAHNGQEFDVPVLRRQAQGLAGMEGLVFYDSLPLARSLSDQSARLVDLATRYGVDAGQSHRALDDARTLAQVFVHLQRTRAERARKAAMVNLLDDLGLALALDPAPGDDAEPLLGVARFHTLGRYGEALEAYRAERTGDAPTVEQVINRIPGGAALMERLRTERTAEQRYPGSVARLRALVLGIEAEGLEPAMRELLDRVALSTSEGTEAARDRVNLLTLHATKGLEFSRVYVIGVEDTEMPGTVALQNQRLGEIEEARRLLYVGMTRARDRLTLTRCRVRRGWPTGACLFLDEIGLG